jgi:hypothetical protein
MTQPGNQPGAPEPRIGDADREAAVTALGEHYAAGRLTKEEFDERADQAWVARTASGLWPLFADLPRATSAGSAGPAARPAAPQRASSRWWLGPVLTPILVVLAVLAVLAHLPLILLIVGVWFLVTRSRHGRPHGCAGHQRRLR